MKHLSVLNRSSVLVIALFQLFTVQSFTVTNLTTSNEVFEYSQRSSSFDLKDIVGSAIGIATGVVENVVNLLPTPKGLFEAAKQALLGYPFLFISSVINEFCSSALVSQAIKPKYSPDIKQMTFQLHTKCKKFYFPLLEADKLANCTDFDVEKDVVILVSGWTTNVNESKIIPTIAQSYHCRGDTNFIAVDVAAFVDTLYTWSAFNTEEIGMHIAEGLKILTEKIPFKNIHLIGHSLGAHIVGAAGRHFYYNTGDMLPRITGLDPANPCFNEGEALSGLLRGDAEFIDVIHSNSGVLGKRIPIGDVDFYPGGLRPLPPGCFDIFCAHARAWKFYAESVYPDNENNFMSKRCTSLKTLLEGKCPGKDIPMGFAVPHNVKGNYFLEVRSNEPFGNNGDRQRHLRHKNCGVCKD